jgi:Icc-related predicted phosphoesterase
MRYFVLSDIHTDLWFQFAVDRKRLECYDPHESVTRETLDYIWKLREYPTDVDGIIVPGDITNDYQSTCYTIKWLSEKYKKVYIVIGNHDMTVRGGTPSQSNLQFLSSYEKVTNIGRYADSLGNCYLLDTSMRERIAGTMGFADFKCCCPDAAWAERSKLYWKRSWYDGKYWRGKDFNADSLWKAESSRMRTLCLMQPKVMVTHFTPIQLGISFDFRNDPLNALFYFDAREFLEIFDHDAYWLCGHVHEAKRAVYTNAKGFKITILCNPNGYPEESHSWVYEPEMSKGQIRAIPKSEYSNDAFIIEV